MWRLKKRKRFEDTPWKDAAAAKIAGVIVFLQLGAARLLARVEQGLSLQQKKVIFFLFCALGAAYCLFLFSRAVGTESKGFSDVPGDEETRIVIPGNDSILDTSIYQYP